MFHSTKTLVTEIPARAMLDLEEIGGEGFRAEYAVLAAVAPIDGGGVMLLVEHEGGITSLRVPHDTTVPVITYAAPSNALEGASTLTRRSS